jgi:hypothetical protein
MADDVAAKPAEGTQEQQKDDQEQEQQEESPEVKQLKADLAKANQGKLSLERALTRQGHELSEQRRLIERVLLTQAAGKQEQPVDFFADPKTAVAQSINEHPTVQGLAQAAQALRQQQMAAQLKASHPDYMEVARGEEFLKWIGTSAKRAKLYLDADQGYDYEAADYLLSEWKDRQAVRTKLEADEKKKNAEALKAAKVDTGSASAGGKKVWNAEDLRQLKIKDPDKYSSLNVAQLYAEGRVRRKE